MILQSQRELENTLAKLKQVEGRYALLLAQPVEDGQEKVREWTLLSLKKLINQFKEEIARFQARAGSHAQS
jgi:flagellar biosynthesis chaperone FliJ